MPLKFTEKRRAHERAERRHRLEREVMLMGVMIGSGGRPPRAELEALAARCDAEQLPELSTRIHRWINLPHIAP